MLKKLYNPRSITKVTDVEKIQEVIEQEQPKAEVKKVGATPIKSRKDRKKVVEKKIGATIVKSRKDRKKK